MTHKTSCCTCTADWVKDNGKDQDGKIVDQVAHTKWWAVVPLVIVNVVTMMIGICFLGVSAYVASMFDEWKQYISWTGLIACVVISLFVFALGLLGCCGAIHRNILCLTIYLFCLFVLCFIVLGVALVVFVYGERICGGFGNEASTCNKNIASREVSNALIKISSECCQTNLTIPLCVSDKSTDLYQCMYPECNGNNKDYCVKAFTPCILGMAKDYTGMKCERKFPPPMTTTPEAMCIGIRTLIFKESPDLNELTATQKKDAILEASIWKHYNEKSCQAGYKKDSKEYKCGGLVGQAKTDCLNFERISWTMTVAGYFETNMKNFGTGLVVLGAFLVIMMLLAFCSCCKNKTTLTEKAKTNNIQWDAQA